MVFMLARFSLKHSFTWMKIAKSFFSGGKEFIFQKCIFHIKIYEFLHFIILYLSTCLSDWHVIFRNKSPYMMSYKLESVIKLSHARMTLWNQRKLLTLHTSAFIQAFAFQSSPEIPLYCVNNLEFFWACEYVVLNLKTLGLNLIFVLVW